MSSNEPVRGEIITAVEELKDAATFLTRLPLALVGLDGSRRPDFRTGARVFPVIGVLVGLAGGIVLVVARALGIPPTLAAALAIATTVLITGALHEDGLADMADGLGGATPEKRLEIMDDSRVGTYGALALAFSVLVRVLALGSLAASGSFRAALVLIAAEAASRAAMVRLWHDLPAARPGGLADETGPPDQNAMLIALALAAAIAVVLCVPTVGLWATVLAGALAALATFVMIRLAGRLLGGRTGDALGATEQLAVMAFLVGASVF